MASAQEAEEFIQSLNGNAAAQGNHVERSAKRLLFEILWFASKKTFHRARAIYPDKIADLHAICQQGSGGQMKGANFKSIVAATDKVHIKSGNFSFEFENNIFNIHADVMRPAWVTPTESVPEDSSRVTLFLPGQDSEEETQKLRDIISSQFERLDEPSILFLQDLISMSVEYFNEAGKLYRSKDFRKHQVDAHRVSVKVTTVDGGLKKGHTQLYHVTEQATADKSMQVILAFPLWDNFKVGGDTCAFGLFNFVQLEASPLRFYVHSDFNFDNQHGPISPSTRTVAIKDLVASAFVQAVLQFCEHPTLRYHWPLFLMSGLEDSDAFWSSLEADIRDWIAQNPVLISRNNKHWRHISHLTILVADAQDEAGNPLLDDEITDPFQNEDLVFYVRSSILDRFSTSNDMSLSEIKRYLVYLYVTHQSSFLELKQPYHSVKVMTIEMQLVQPRDTIVYMPNIDLPYGPEKLLGSDFSFHNGHLHFLHRDILNEEPTAPHQFLGFIQYLWASDGPRVMKSPSLVPEIQGLPAQSLCTGDRSLRLQDTWVPLKVLRESVWHYMESPDEFPFLDLGNESAMDVAIYTKWDFLVKDLGVKRQNDMAFLLEILNSIKLSCREISSWQTEKVFDLYTAINKRLQLAVSGERGRALAFFEDSGVLYIREAGPIWTGLSSCRWNAPANLITKYSLETLLRRRDAEQEQMDSLSELFRVGMSVTDVSVKDLVEELLVLRNEGCEDVARVTEIYKYLDESLSATDEIRTAFEECAVILVKKDSHCMWLKTSQCFWSEAETAPLNSSLRGCYSDLESFFIDKLRIKVSAYDKLLTLSTDTEDHSMVQGLLLSLMDETKGSLNEFPPAPMHKVNIFEVNSPQRSGQPYIPTKLCSVDTDFAIGDRPEFRIELAHDIKMLAYDLKVVRRLQPLFRWLSIEDRYLSRCVKERLNDVFSFRHGILNLRDKAHQIARGVKRSLVSALPKRLQEWLMKDTHRSSGINEFEVANALTSIFNASGPDLDRILWEQGIVEVPFENVHLKQKKAMIKVRLPQVDEHSVAGRIGYMGRVIRARFFS
ncbi:uncharacterized protein B0J16DRAFT_396233 [Fusarium flagelliforme]|uniref:uncharacterized protein n=1 Tax=Fusarium flagelliforme TaxID=2675880 RepID=UPI001E8E4A32|nr:uncharacterized protein B0J16DRAFT_396233 [Fusarium flagelliforme]KAH7188072.1 hypothetical protein B0J16DRAFT_396233 [Fusarium flagelliforme]